LETFLPGEMKAYYFINVYAAVANR